jgi:hypothetical protein
MMTQFEYISSNVTTDEDVIDISYNVERTISLREEPCEQDIFVNETDGFDSWWDFTSLQINRSVREDFLDEVRSFDFLKDEVYQISPGEEGYSFDEDCKIAYQLTRESPVDLFMDHCYCEVVRYDHKEGLMKGSWSHCYEWGEIKNNQELWDWIEKNKSKLEIKITF